MPGSITSTTVLSISEQKHGMAQFTYNPDNGKKAVLHSHRDALILALTSRGYSTQVAMLFFEL